MRRNRPAPLLPPPFEPHHAWVKKNRTIPQFGRPDEGRVVSLRSAAAAQDRRQPPRPVAALYGSQPGTETTPARLLSRLGQAPPARPRSGRARLRGRPPDSATPGARRDDRGRL